MATATGAIGLTFVVAQLTAGQPALPRNPERPVDPKTCEEARARVEEATKGSPLISPEENKIILNESIKRAKQMCPVKT
jgi:hypothetical protein